jgi:putative membrane protein
MNTFRRVLGAILITLMLVIGVSVGLFNAQAVQFDYLAGQIELPLIWLLTLVIAFSVLVALAAASVPLLRQRRRIARLERDLQRARDALNTQRNLPLRDTSAS